jgi:hypothetical protein
MADIIAEAEAADHFNMALLGLPAEAAAAATEPRQEMGGRPIMWRLDRAEQQILAAAVGVQVRRFLLLADRE